MVKSIFNSKKIGVMVVIENVSVLVLEDELLDKVFECLDYFIEECQYFFYISFIYYIENRFGGGNYSDNVGLKDDGKCFLEYMNGK